MAGVGVVLPRVIPSITEVDMELETLIQLTEQVKMLTIMLAVLWAIVALFMLVICYCLFGGKDEFDEEDEPLKNSYEHGYAHNNKYDLYREDMY